VNSTVNFKPKPSLINSAFVGERTVMDLLTFYLLTWRIW
jgi:hypothetical protein